MGWASEMQIDLHNERMATDEQYAADYEENMRMDAALEAAFFESERELEKYVDWFADWRIDFTGFEEIDAPEPEDNILIDEDIPF